MSEVRRRHRSAATALQRLADRNLVQSYELLARHTRPESPLIRSFGGAVAAFAGGKAPFFNPILVVEERASAADVVAAIVWAAALGVPPSIQVRSDLDAVVAAAAAERGLAPDPWSAPGMVLAIPDVLPDLPAELRVDVVGRDRIDAWYDAAGGAMRGIIPATFADDAAVRLLVGTVEGRPVSHSIAIGDERCAGIYAVGTAPDARRRGYGAALTWAAMAAGRAAWGATTAVLQSSAMGDRVYRGMGFVEICRYRIYLPPPAA